MKMIKWLALTVSALLLLTGCGNRQEKLGDEHLAAGRLTNAIAMYTKAEQKGKTSDHFYDNFSLAYLRMAMAMAKKGKRGTKKRGGAQGAELSEAFGPIHQ